MNGVNESIKFYCSLQSKDLLGRINFFLFIDKKHRRIHQRVGCRVTVRDADRLIITVCV